MLVIKQARLYAPEPKGIQDILVEGGKIVRISPSINEYDGIGEVEKLQLDGRRLAPGYIDCHEHITGGGGEQGPRTRVPEAQLSTIFRCGVTTVLGLLGTDGITRSLENLQAKCQALNEEGLSCYMLTGSYAYPSPTLTGDVERDIMLIHEVIGVKVAMSDHRSSHITGEELIRLGTLARRGGMLAGCAGLVTIHTGSGKAGLGPIFYALEKSDLPPSTFLPTHIGRNDDLFSQALTYAKMGGRIDITAGSSKEANEKVADKICRYLEEDPQLQQLSLSSDAYGSQPRFNEKMECIGLTYATPQSLHEVIRILVEERQVPLETALRLLTTNPAQNMGLQQTKGRIAPGYDADFIVYDDDLAITGVLAKGKKAVWEGKVLMKGTFEE
ncbi:beta-aspartyl-peptidase [Acidaminococcus sp. LBK-2]|uniref:beta-aspartyl-peptidase n=1 Tax=Acidaminococcus sp. LBK-2 TaxID=3456956 RepID=UPI003FA421C8